jgi:hypothetical protein
MRHAISAMLPGAGTPSRKYAEKQMQKLQVEIDALQKGVPTLGNLSGSSSTPAASGKGTSKVSDLVKKYGGG